MGLLLAGVGIVRTGGRTRPLVHTVSSCQGSCDRAEDSANSLEVDHFVGPTVAAINIQPALGVKVFFGPALQHAVIYTLAWFSSYSAASKSFPK